MQKVAGSRVSDFDICIDLAASYFFSLSVIAAGSNTREGGIALHYYIIFVILFFFVCFFELKKERSALLHTWYIYLYSVLFIAYPDPLSTESCQRLRNFFEDTYLQSLLFFSHPPIYLSSQTTLT